MSNEKFYGYCYVEPDGEHMPPVTLDSPEEVYRYTQLHGKGPFFREVRITDSSDFIVVQMIDGKYTYPPEWEALNGGTT